MIGGRVVPPMPKSTITFVCTECGGESLRWAGQCPHCQAWNTLQEFQVRKAATGRASARERSTAATKPIALSEIESEAAPRRPLAWDELNRVLGGGVVPGSIVLVGGEPGVGKSTLLMHAAAQVAQLGDRGLYISGEESAQQVRMRAERLGALRSGIFLLAENRLDLICDAISAEPTALAIIDSIQTVTDAGFEGSAGSVTQVRESAARLMRLAEEIGVFAMGESGLEEVPDPSAALLGTAVISSPGTAIVAALEGTRPLLVEIQSLVNKTDNAMVRGVANGIDINRLHMILAVLEKRLDHKFGKSDIFVSVTGGIRVTEPAADLGLALSIVSNQDNRPLPDGLVVIGELGLTGEVRRVGQLERRLQEAARHGLKRALIPPGTKAGRPSGLDVVEVRTLAEAVSAAFSKPIASGAFIREAGVSVS